jgi:hypothetical protein
MKIYIASLLALSNVQDASDPTPLFITMSVPALIPAASIQAASEVARAHAFERWKPEEGWHSHQANIMPVTESFYDAFVKASQAGIIDMSDEEGKSFNF